MFTTYVGKPLQKTTKVQPVVTKQPVAKSTKTWGNAIKEFYNRLMIILCCFVAILIVGTIIF